MNIENPENLNALYELNDNNDEDEEKKEHGPKEEDSFGEDPNEKEDIPLYDKEELDED